VTTDYYINLPGRDGMKIVQYLVPPSKYDIKCPYSMVAEFLVVHNTANDANAISEVAYMIRNDNKISFHYAVDDREIVQGIPDNRNAWHAGDGVNGEGNRKGLSVEICFSKSGGSRFKEAEKLAVKFIAYKLNEMNWGIERVKKHQDFSGKYCPHRTLDMGWQRFLDMVQAELDLLNEKNEADKDKPSSWAQEAWDWAKKEGITDGTRPGDTATREEVITMLYRYHKQVIEG